jgi:uncharacterized protein (DUF885 family)
MSKRFIFGFVAAAALCMPLVALGDDQQSPAPSAPLETPVPAAGDAALAVLAERYYQGEWKFSPTNATTTGVHEYDALLDPVSPEAIESEIASLRATLSNLQRLDPARMSLDGQTDQRILEASIQTNMFWLAERPQWQQRPSYYTDIAAGGVYGIMSRAFAPLPDRLKLVIAREKLIPAMLAQGEKNLHPADISQIVATTDALDAEGSVDFFAQDVHNVFGSVKDAGLQAQFEASNAAAIKALKSYAAFLRTNVVPRAHGSFAIGPAAYSKLELWQNMVDIPLATLLRVGEADLAKNKAAFIATARAIDRTKTPEQVMALVHQDHPTNDELIPVAQADLDGLVAFIKAKNIIDLPAAPIAKVRKTPQFQAQTSFASMNSPGPLETKATEAYYNVTVVDPHWTAAQKKQHLEFFNRPGLFVISLHETYPGHYTNYLYNKGHDLSLIRKLEWNNAFGEGWAHYDEQMMVDEGLGNGDPRYRLMQLALALQRDCRYIVGIKEHTQGMTIDQATAFFAANAYMGREPSYREAVRGTGDPLYGYYTLGKLMILKLRADYQAKQAGSYKLSQFHDELLSHGDPPLYFSRKFLLGADDKGSLL